LAGGGALALGVPPAGASAKQVTAVGSATTYQVMHALFPTSLHDTLPGGTTANQTVASTATFCNGGVTYSSGGAPNGSTTGKNALLAEETATATKKGCITIGRSASPPKPSTASPNFDYYAFALDGVAPMVGTNAGGTVTGTTAAFTLNEIKGIYRCTAGHTTWASLGGHAGAIVRFWPPTGSDTRSVYSDILGFTPSKAATKGTCATPAVTTFTTVTVGGTKKSVVNEENTESGLVYATKVLHDTIKDDIYVYSAATFVSQWNDLTRYGSTASQPNRINGATIGNFTSTHVELGSIRLRPTGVTTPTGTPEPFVKFTATPTSRTTVKAGVNTSVVSEANEWYSHIPAAAGATTSSTSTVPGVRYLFNVCDLKTTGYAACKDLVGFDNQINHQAGTQTTGSGTKSRLCAADLSATISAQGFVPLTKTGHPRASTSSNLAGAACREFPGQAYPGLASPATHAYTSNAWVNPTGGGPGSGQAGPTGPTTRYAEQPGYPVVDNTGTSVMVTTAAVGDVMLVMAHTAPSTGTAHVTSISDSAGRIAWQPAKSAGFTNHPSGDAVELWYGVVESVGPTTIDAHWSGTTFDHFVWADEWTSLLGPDVSWSVVSSGIDNSSLGRGTSCAYPTLTSGPSGGLYWGWAYGSAVGSAGTSAGFGYYVTRQPTHENVLVSDPSLAPSTTYTPNFTQAAATSWYDAAAIVIQAATTGS